MSCGQGCGCGGGCGSGLGQVNTPRSFTPEEVQLFLIYNQDNERLQDYLRTKDPPWGIIVPDSGRDFLVYSPQGTFGTVYVVDVTGSPIKDEVEKAPYVSPDDTGFFGNLMTSVNNLVSTSMDFLTMGAYVLTAYAIWDIFRNR